MLINYQPPGPVAAAFHADSSFFRGIKGPVGSGKSSTSCLEIITRALEQLPGPDNVRRTRSIIIRNTYPELKSTTIKTWMDWFGDICTIKWDAPITGTIDLKLPDGTSLYHEAIFLAIDRPDDVGKLRSLEATFAWLNEASELEKNIADMVTQRVGRYPAKRMGGPTWTGIIADTNPPDDDHWWYQWAEVDKPEGYKFFDQPGGLVKVIDPISPQFGQWVPNPAAENAENLPGGYQYYLRQVAGKSEDYIKVFLGGMYGTTMDGKPVYPEWNDKVHMASGSLTPIPGYPISAGFDFGLTPSVIFGQMDHKGRVLVLKELTSESMGIRQFYGDLVRPWIQQNWSNHRIEAVGDPAGATRAQSDEKTCFQELLEMGLLCEPASTNDFLGRRESVAYFLQRMASGEPGFIVDPSCKTIRKGFNGGYRYERIKTGGSARFKDRPIKDKFSHPHDALQYLCLKLRGNLNPVRARPVEVNSMNGWT